MKKPSQFKSFLLIIMGLIGSNLLAAEVIVHPGLNTLLVAVENNPGSTFLLERGGNYVMTTDIVLDAPTTIKAADGDLNLSPPVIQCFTDPGDAGNRKMFVVGADVTFEGLGLHGFTPMEEQLGKALITCSVGDITVTIDGCIIQAAHQFLEFSGRNNNHYIIKNNIFFNLCNEGWDNFGGFGSIFGGEESRFEAYNNTYFMVGRVFNAGGFGPGSTEKMDHNTYVNVWGDTYYPSNAKDVVITNNLYYNTQMRGYVGERTNNYGEVIWAGDLRDWTLNGDTLSGDVSIFPHELDSTGTDDDRTVEITNNVKLYDLKCLDFFAENNVSAQTFWNKGGREVYGPRFGWTFKDNYLQEDGNEIDPMFEMGDLPNEAYTYAFLTRLERQLPPDEQSSDFPYKIVWLPEGASISEFIWPLPFDFTPTNKSLLHLGSDGYPIGDLNWFGEDVVEAWENKVLYEDLDTCFFIINDTIWTEIVDNVSVTVYDTIWTEITETIYDSVTVSVYDTIYRQISVSDTLVIEVYTGTGSVNGNSLIKVYPNPAHDVIVIDWDDAPDLSGYSYRIINSDGKSIKLGLMDSAPAEIDISELGVSGLYILQIFNSQMELVTSRKILITAHL